MAQRGTIELPNIDTTLDPSKNQNQKQHRLRVDTLENENDYGEDIASSTHSITSIQSNVSAQSDLDMLNDLQTYSVTRKELFVSYIRIAIEGDLAGFQIFWLLMSVGFIIMKIFNITDVVQEIEWWAIFIIPICNALLTAWFDFIIRKYQSTKSEESLRKTRFIMLWLLKISFAIYVTTYWIWGPNSHMDRFYDEFKDEGGTACTGQIICVYTSVLAATMMSEIMISTVLINSEQNLSDTRTPIGYRVILLFIRPIVWVYNRTMVMFLCFYSIYGLFMSAFVVGLICNEYCDHYYTNRTQQIGLEMLLVPFTVPNYLSKSNQVFLSWKEISNEDFLQTFVVVFLCQSFYVDVLNSIWQFSRRFLKPKRKLNYTIRGEDAIEKDKEFFNDLAKELPASPSSPSSPHEAGNKVTTISLKKNSRVP